MPNKIKQATLGTFYVCAALTGLLLSALIWDFIFRIAIVLILYVALPVSIIGGIIYVIYSLIKSRQ